MSRAKAVMHHVTLLATKEESGDYRFEPDSDLWDEAEQHFLFDKARHGIHVRDYHLVEFVLEDRTGDGLKFAPIPHDAMWVARGAERAKRQCPNMHTVSDYTVMEPICVCDEGERLIVRNDNPRKEEWAFTLNFVKRGADPGARAEYASWDPGGSNQNGGGTDG